MLLGLWEGPRGAADHAAFEAERSRLERVVADLEARAPQDGRIDFGMRFQREGQTYVGPLALKEARAARDQAASMTGLMDWRRRLPPVAVAAGGLAAALSGLVLLAGAGLGWAGRASREALARGFSVMRRALPAMLAVQILATAAAFVAVVTFEVGALARPGLGSGEIKLLMLAGVAIMAALYAAVSAAVGLRGALAAFAPDPLPIFGRPVSPAEPPGLWRLTGTIADRLGALTPDAIVVGVTDGFFVTAGAVALAPGGERLTGRTLYLPLPQLALMRGDETAAIIAHELAHYAGGDTAYSQRFLPIYAGVARSLDAVERSREGSFGLLGPSLRLGQFVMDRFHLGVRRWSRAREFSADAAGAAATSADASARALLRIGPVEQLVAATLDQVAEAPESAPDDLVAAAVERAIERGLDDPAGHLETRQPHPTDSHPATGDRVAALGRDVDARLLAEAGAPPDDDALEQLADYFADPSEIRRIATADFVEAIRARDEALTAHLGAAAEAVNPDGHVLRDNGRAMAIFHLCVGVLFGAVAIALAALGVPDMPPRHVWIISAVVFAIGAGFAVYGAYALRLGDRVTLALTAEGLAPPGLDRTIAWEHVADLDLTMHQNRMTTRLQLSPEAPLPQRLNGGRFVKVDARRRVVTLTFGLPRRMTPQAFAELIASHQNAAYARRVLGERRGQAPEGEF